MDKELYETMWNLELDIELCMLDSVFYSSLFDLISEYRICEEQSHYI